MASNILFAAILYAYIKLNNEIIEMNTVMLYLKIPLVLYFMAHMTMMSYVLLRRARQLRQNEKINAYSFEDFGDFCLYLRAFRSAGKIKLPYMAPQWNYTIFLGNVIDAELAISLQAHRLGMSVLALGDTATGYGASKINTSDDNWIAAYERLADGARFIVMAPFDRPSTLFEIKNIFRTPERLRKTLFVMPPRLRFSPLSPSTWIQENFETRWKKTTDYLAKEDITLPPYHRKGRYFAYDPDSGAVTEQEIIGSTKKITAQIFKTLSINGNAAGAIAAASQARASKKSWILAPFSSANNPSWISPSFIFLMLVGFFLWMEAYQLHVVRRFCQYSSSQRAIPVYNIFSLYRCEEMFWVFWDEQTATDPKTRRRLDSELTNVSRNSGIELHRPN